MIAAHAWAVLCLTLAAANGVRPAARSPRWFWPAATATPNARPPWSPPASASGTQTAAAGQPCCSPASGAIIAAATRAHLNQPTPHGATPLYLCCAWAEALLATGLVDPDTALRSNGTPPLTVAAQAGSMACACALVCTATRWPGTGAGRAVSLSSVTAEGRTALMMAAAGGHHEVATALLKAGGCWFQADAGGITAEQVVSDPTVCPCLG